MKSATLDIWEVLSHFVDLGAAYILALPIGWDREQRERSAGVRTFPLVAIASCGFVLIALRVLGAENSGQARILEGLITGVGFIGGGAILKRAGQASGTATAGATGALGAAVGYGLYDIAAILSLTTFVTLRWLSAAKSIGEGDTSSG